MRHDQDPGRSCHMKSWFRRLIGEPGDRERIAAAQTPKEIPDLLPFAFGATGESRAAAIRALHALIQDASFRDLLLVEETTRHRGPYTREGYFAWFGFQPTMLPKLGKRAGEAASSVLGVASFHPNGHVREMAVRGLDVLSNGKELPFLLIRMNDWVSQVRERAVEAAARRLRIEYAPWWLQALPLVLRLGKVGRSNHEDFVRHVMEFLKQPECRSALLGGLGVQDRIIRCTAFQLALELPEADWGDIASRASEDLDPAIRLMAARRIHVAHAIDPLRPLLMRLLCDPVMVVRREALTIIAERCPREAEAPLRQGLLDRHAAIRETSRFHLKGAGLDFAALGRAALAAQPSPGAIESLGEVGTPADASLVLPFVSHVRPKMRRAVLRALVALAGEAHTSVFLQALQDPSPGVSGQARKGLEARAMSLDPGALWEIFQRAGSAHARRNALLLLSRGPKWDVIPMLVEACGSASPEVARVGRDRVRRWVSQFNRTFVSAKKEQIEQLAKALKQHGQAVDPACREFLQMGLGKGHVGLP